MTSAAAVRLIDWSAAGKLLLADRFAALPDDVALQALMRQLSGAVQIAGG